MDSDENTNKIKARGKSISSVWESVVKDIEQEDRRSSKSYSDQFNPYDAKVEFCTGSLYEGKYNRLGMAASGKYTFPHGCVYEGSVEDGMFNGEGVLRYPMGQELRGVWKKGQLVSFEFAHCDGLPHDSDSTYCKMPDRRFTTSLKEGLQPAGKEFMANYPDRPVPPGYYDTADGYYEPVSRTLIASRDPHDYEHLEPSQMDDAPPAHQLEDDSDFWDTVLNAMSKMGDERHNWIVNNCRKGWDEPAGFRPELYADWVSGRSHELEKLEEKYSPAGDGDCIANQPIVPAKITKSVEYALTEKRETQ